MTRKVLILFVLLISTLSFALPVNLTISLQDFSQQPLRSFVSITLQTTGTCTLSSSSGTFGTATKDYYPPLGSGTIVISITPQAAIFCGTVPNTTWYLIQIKQKDQFGNIVIVSSGKYQIPSSDSNLKDLQLFNSTAPSPTSNYAIRNGDNTFVGTQDFSQATVVGIGSGPGGGAAVIDHFVTTQNESDLTNEVTFAQMNARGTAASRPVSDPTKIGRIYCQNDSGNMKCSRDNGTTWDDNGISWNNIDSKPATFAPSAHTHAESEVTSLVSDLGTKPIKPIADCHNLLTDKVVYDQTTNTLGCGTDQTGAGGSGITNINGLTATTQTIDTINDTNIVGTWTQSSSSNHRLTFTWSGTLAKARIVATAVFTDQANSFGAFLQDLSASTMKVPISAGYAPTVNGLFGYDSTANEYSVGVNGANKRLAFKDLVLPLAGGTMSGAILRANNAIIFSANKAVSGTCDWFLNTTDQWETACGIKLTSTGPDDLIPQAAPGTPATGHVYRWIDSTDLIEKVKNAAGTTSTTVIGQDCGAGVKVQGISSAGVLNCQADLTSAGGGLGDPGGNGVVVRTAAGTTTNRTITGTANEISATNGDGVSGNPTLSLPSSLVLTSKQVKYGESTVASLPAASTVSGVSFLVTDLAVAGACGTGGGTAKTWCRSNGTTYEAVGDGNTGGGSPTLYAWWSGTNVSGTVTNPGVNATRVFQVVVDHQVSVNKIAFKCSTADNNSGVGHKYDLGLYNSSGTLVLKLGGVDGTVFCPSTATIQDVSVVGAPVSIAPATYYAAITMDCSASCAVLSATGSTLTPYSVGTAGTTTNGILNSTFTPGAVSWVNVSVPYMVIHN
jgi:hypothetical protein